MKSIKRRNYESTPIGDILVKILKLTVDIHLPFIINSIGWTIQECCFLEELKLAGVSPVFIKNDGLGK